MHSRRKKAIIPVLSQLVPHDTDCLLFDWDGTLVDSQSANYRAMATALSQVGVELEESWFGARTGLSSAEMINALIRERSLTLPVTVQEIVTHRDELFLEEAHRVQAQPALLDIVNTWYGRLPMAVASGGSRSIILETMRHLPYASRFTTVVTREDVKRGKPAPDIFLLAAHRLGAVPERCTVYEDSDEGIVAAAAAGMTVIDVRPYTGR
ncbi:Fructose-1-phosphate phosphatase YqaB [Nonomuraea coxensis DSM 45129]|uniref:Fructose-1-phosphate phosphatase YqaB n=1 Tax=Nonomuraea coxensis DSM 45129 TaxID=1122611 RepID=A0ABX8TU60_9ACTN|nr:Fructose-1-phosphate phosphatase YqaB [Nonomuraea coxensis DSM 45129]